MLLLNKNAPQIHAYITTEIYNELETDQLGHFIPSDIDLEKIPVQVSRIVGSYASILQRQNANNENFNYIHKGVPLSAYYNTPRFLNSIF